MSFAQWMFAGLAVLGALAVVWFMIDRKGNENPETVIDEPDPDADAKVQTGTRDGPGPWRPK